ncbi:hypothetical protein CIHG_05582 [Coccidioides immitis H538.4]|uniref:Uncharacterized protein n=1 Tax=Coccidioides immitis H538.4 TaxID=396776 RepID=A0A0J8RUR9_COCIT|nr:hypothetical protein CIHG_05582 [Coccidioides immitis H538.4]
MYEVRIFIDGFCVSAGIIAEKLQGEAFSTKKLIGLMSSNGVLNWTKMETKTAFASLPFTKRSCAIPTGTPGRCTAGLGLVLADGPPQDPIGVRAFCPLLRAFPVFSFPPFPLSRTSPGREGTSITNVPLCFPEDIDVLEHSNIAWPNPGMWLQGPRAFLPYSVGGEKAYVKDDDAAFAFTKPSRHSAYNRNCSNNRSTLDDVSMPDYVASTTSSSRAISSNMSFSRNQEPSAPAPIDDEQYNQLIEALSPKKVVSGGTCAPANTPVSTAPKKTKLSATAETRVKATRSGPLQEISQPGSRVSSASSVVSDASSGGKLPGSLLSPSPNAFGKEKALSPASSRDGSVSRGTHLKPTLPVTSSIDSKRKRSPKTDRKSIDSTSSLSPTPSKKISRRKEKETLEKENSSDLSATRATRLSISDVE